MRKPRALTPGDRIAVVAPASPFARDEFDAGIEEIRTLGFEPVFEQSVFERKSYLAGPADVRAAAWVCNGPPKAFIGYGDNTSILSWLTTRCGIVSVHGPMLEGRLAKGEAGYDR